MADNSAAGELLAKLLVEIGVELDQASADKADKTVDDLGTKAVAKGQLIADAIGKGVSLAIGAISNLAGSLRDALVDFGELGSEVADTSSKLGVSTTELQRMRFAAERAGGSAALLDGAVKKLNIGLTEASVKGTGPFAEGLKLAGVELRELEGLSAEDQIGLLGEALSEITDPAMRATVAARLFGEESGPALQELLGKGREGIRALGDDAERLGLVMGDDAVEAAGKFDDSIKLVEMQVKAAGGRMVSQLAPAVSDMAERFAAWTAENDDFIERDLPGALLAIAEAGADVLVWVVDVIHEFEQFGKLIRDTADDVESLTTEIADELSPAIEVITTVAEAWGSAFVKVNTTIGDGIATVLDYIGVLDTLRDAWNKLPFVGESLDDLTSRLHGGTTSQRGGVAFNANPDGSMSSNERSRQEALGKTIADKISVALALGSAGKVSQDAAALARGEVTTARRDTRGAARARGARELAGGGGGGGGAKSSSGGGGNPFLDLWNAITGTPEPTWMDRAASAIGLGEGVSHGAAGGGGSPLSGASFNRIDASFSAPTTIEVHVDGATIEGQSAMDVGRTIGDGIADRLGERNRQLFDHMQATVRGL